ncbi:MAG: S26 family signal peptidase [Chitinophagaceae bacterium]
MKVSLPISLSFLLFCLLHTSCGRSYRQRSTSMEKTIMAGQKFTVHPSDSFERNDMVVFDYYGKDYSAPLEEDPRQFKMHWEKRIFRIVAVSGDIVEIREGYLFVNNKAVAPPPLSKSPYIIKASVDPDLSQLDPNAAGTSTQIGDTLLVTAELTSTEADSLKNSKNIWSVERYLMNFSDTLFAMNSETDNWSLDNYGPLKIPSVREAINVNTENYKLFKNIPGIKMGSNLVKDKLYFVLGDSRSGAEDSRFIGLIPHSSINGIVK